MGQIKKIETKAPHYDFLTGAVFTPIEDSKTPSPPKMGMVTETKTG